MRAMAIGRSGGGGGGRSHVIKPGSTIHRGGRGMHYADVDVMPMYVDQSCIAACMILSVHVHETVSGSPDLVYDHD